MKLARPVRVGAAGAAAAALLLGSPALAKDPELLSKPSIGTTTVDKHGNAAIKVSVSCRTGAVVELYAHVEQRTSKSTTVYGHGSLAVPCERGRASEVVPVSASSPGSKGKSAWTSGFRVGSAKITAEVFGCMEAGWGCDEDEWDEDKDSDTRKLSRQRAS